MYTVIPLCSLVVFMCFLNLASAGTVAFTATISNDLKVESTTDSIVFDKVITNAGNRYDVETGCFTAPYKGGYVFHWTIIAMAHSSFRSYLAVNGVLKRRNLAKTNTGKTNESGSSMVALSLNANDKVCIFKEVNKYELSGDTIFGGETADFTGFMIFKE